MKKLFALTFVTFLAILFIVISTARQANAAATLILGSLTPITNSVSTTTPVTAFSYNQTLQQFQVTHGTITNTNQFHLDLYINVQGANTNGRTKIGVWWPSYTNATTETFSGSSYAATNWLSLDAVVTNGNALGINYGN